MKPWMWRALRVVASVAIICALLLIEFHYHDRLRNTTVTYTLLLAILFFAVRWDRLETILASVVAALPFSTIFRILRLLPRSYYRVPKNKSGARTFACRVGTRADAWFRCGTKCWHECQHGTQECARHFINLLLP